MAGRKAGCGGASEGVKTSTASITFDDVMDLFYSLKSPYRKKAAFIMNDATLKALRKLKDNNGTYIWQPAGRWLADTAGSGESSDDEVQRLISRGFDMLSIGMINDMYAVRATQEDMDRF